VGTLGDYVTLQRGTTYKSNLLGQPGPVLLGLASIRRNGGFRDDSLRTYGGESPAKLMLGPGDLYVSLKDVTQAGDLLGAVSRVPSNVSAGRLTQDTVRLDLLDGAPDASYVYWLLRTPQYRDYCRARAIGTTNLSLSRDDFLAYPVPALTQDRRLLVAMLELLDRRIDSNRRVSVTLESIARALFKSWFVDFDSLQAKAGGALPELSGDLFPPQVRTTTIGACPEEWEIKPLDGVAHFLNGLALQKYPPTGESDLPTIKGAELMRGVTATSSFASGDVPTKYVVRAGDVLFSWSGSLNCVIWTDVDGALNQHVFKVTSGTYPRWFVYFWVREHLPEFRLIAADKATTMGHIKRSHLSNAEVLVPPNEVLARADRVIGPLVDRWLAAESESRQLAHLRDVLLPRLMSGSLEIPQVSALQERSRHAAG